MNHWKFDVASIKFLNRIKNIHLRLTATSILVIFSNFNKQWNVTSHEEEIKNLLYSDKQSCFVFI